MEPAFLTKVFVMALPFGRRRILWVFLVVVAQGAFQVAGVTSIFPFLALAADPSQIHNSQYCSWVLSFLPAMSPNQLLGAAGAFAILFMILANAVNVVSAFVRNRYAHDFGHWLRIRLLNRILDQQYSYFLDNNSAVLLKKVYTDVMGYINGVLLPLLEAVARLLTSALLIATLLFIHLEISLIAAFVICGIYLSIFFLLRKRRAELSNELKTSWRDCAIELQQLFGGIKPIKVHEVEEPFVERFEMPSKKVSTFAAWLPIYSSVPRYVIEPVAFSGVIALVVYLNWRGHDMAAVLPSIGVMALAGYRLLPSLQLLYGQLTQISSYRFTIEEVYEEFRNAEGIPHRDCRRRSTPLKWSESIRLEKVSFAYPDSKPILNSVSLKIRKNTSVAFVGQTGSGKSTLIDLITGLHEPTDGRILVGGISIHDDLSAWRGTIGYVPQDVFLIDDTIAGNIAIGIPAGQIDRERLLDAAETAQILGFVRNDLPNGFDTVVGERGVKLSGGQRQRIGLARALYRNPSVLIFDEATSALDGQTEAELMAAINALAQQKTLITIAHRLSTVRECDQIYLLEDGTVRLRSFDDLHSQSPDPPPQKTGERV